MEYTELTEEEIAIQFEGTTIDGVAPDESLAGQLIEKFPEQAIKKRRKLKNDSIFLSNYN